MEVIERLALTALLISCGGTVCASGSAQKLKCDAANGEVVKLDSLDFDCRLDIDVKKTIRHLYFERDGCVAVFSKFSEDSQEQVALEQLFLVNRSGQTLISDRYIRGSKAPVIRGGVLAYVEGKEVGSVFGGVTVRDVQSGQVLFSEEAVDADVYADSRYVLYQKCESVDGCGRDSYLVLRDNFADRVFTVSTGGGDLQDAVVLSTPTIVIVGFLPSGNNANNQQLVWFPESNELHRFESLSTQVSVAPDQQSVVIQGTTNQSLESVTVYLVRAGLNTISEVANVRSYSTAEYSNSGHYFWVNEDPHDAFPGGGLFLANARDGSVVYREEGLPTSGLNARDVWLMSDDDVFVYTRTCERQSVGVRERCEAVGVSVNNGELLWAVSGITKPVLLSEGGGHLLSAGEGDSVLISAKEGGERLTAPGIAFASGDGTRVLLRANNGTHVSDVDGSNSVVLSLDVEDAAVSPHGRTLLLQGQCLDDEEPVDSLFAYVSVPNPWVARLGVAGVREGVGSVVPGLLKIRGVNWAALLREDGTDSVVEVIELSAEPRRFEIFRGPDVLTYSATQDAVLVGHASGVHIVGLD